MTASCARLSTFHCKGKTKMGPDDVIREFERLALDDDQELEIDDVVTGLAVLLTDPTIQGKERALLVQVGATLYRAGLNERVVAALKRKQ